MTDWGYELRSRLALLFAGVCVHVCPGGGLSLLLVLQRHQYTLDRPFSYAYSQPQLVAGATTAILPFLAVPREDFIKQQSKSGNLTPITEVVFWHQNQS